MALEKVRLSKKKFLTRQVLECILECEDTVTVEPGQYILLRVGDEWKPFSIAGTPTEKSLKLVVQLIEGTETSRFFKKVHIDDLIDIQEPQGNVSVPKNHDSVFVATGTGIIPLLVIARHALESGYRHNMHIIFGVRGYDNLFYGEEMQALADKYGNCKVTITMSSPHPEWHGFKGRVSDYLEKNLDNMRGSEFYVCGRKETVATIMDLLEEDGVPSEKRHLIE